MRMGNPYENKTRTEKPNSKVTFTTVSPAPTSGRSSVSKECRSKSPGLNSFGDCSPLFLWLEGRELTGGVEGSM